MPGPVEYTAAYFNRLNRAQLESLVGPGHEEFILLFLANRDAANFGLGRPPAVFDQVRVHGS
jgi:hypothetical protein